MVRSKMIGRRYTCDEPISRPSNHKENLNAFIWLHCENPEYDGWKEVI